MSFIDHVPVLAGLNYFKGQVLNRAGLRGHFSGATAYGMTLDEVVSYVWTVADDYLHYGAVDDLSRIRGKDILELGPGDNLGVALAFLARGARGIARSSVESNDSRVIHSRTPFSP